ncbi:MAG TPA: malectin domain-containing carbohydrate-binding protein [Terriglobales bacterium]
MPSLTADSAHAEAVRAELQSVLQSQAFTRSPGLSHLLSYLCEKVLNGESSQIKEYSIALDVFGRQESFDQDSDSIVRVQANRLRKRLAEFYSGEGRSHRLHINIPVGQYVAVFEEHEATASEAPSDSAPVHPGLPHLKMWIAIAISVLGMAAVFSVVMFWRHGSGSRTTQTAATSAESATPMVGLPVGDEIRILAGATHSYVDRAGKLWSPDANFTGGTVVRSTVQHIWRTQDPAIYRTSRQGDFQYDIPLKPGIYELRLHFAETYYGPEDIGGGGEGSRVMNISANGKPLINNLDVLTDASGGRTADVKVFTDVTPASNGALHLSFTSVNGRSMVSAIEIVPGYRGRMRPVRIVARDVPYYSNNSQWWSSDTYFRGGQLSGSEEPASDTDDPELYETERWGHFSYAIPVPPGEYKLTLRFIERGVQHTNSAAVETGEAGRDRIFDVFCNGKLIVHSLNLKKEAGENRPVVRKFSGLLPNAQGKLLVEFVPSSQYATVSAIEVTPE